jgi:hypothetical protein
MRFENAEHLKRYLSERFDITLPASIRLKQTSSHGIRVFAENVTTERVFGLEGFMAYSHNLGLDPYFIQLIGHLARKNVVALKREDAAAYAEGSMLKKKITTEPGLVILSYKGHILGYGVLEGKGTIKCPLREKRKRALEGDIAPYPGRNI